MDNLERERAQEIGLRSPRLAQFATHLPTWMERPSPYWKGESSPVLVHSFDESHIEPFL
jgi:hypothetical protein